MTACLAATGCITCGDEAISMQVLRVDRARGLALCCDPQGARCSVETALVAPVAPGETLLVHAGTALGRAAEGAGLRVGAGSRVLEATELEVPS
jgi:hydrogenase maturation factor